MKAHLDLQREVRSSNLLSSTILNPASLRPRALRSRAELGSAADREIAEGARRRATNPCPTHTQPLRRRRHGICGGIVAAEAERVEEGGVAGPVDESIGPATVAAVAPDLRQASPSRSFRCSLLSAPERNRRLSSEVGDESFHLEPNFERQLPRMLPMEHATSPSRIPAFQVEYSTTHSYTQ